MYESRNEIERQAASLKQTWRAVLAREADIKSFFAEAGDVVFIACGSSYWLSLSAHMTFSAATGLRAFAVKAGDIVLSREDYTGRYVNPVFVMPSRSGATTEQMESIAILRAAYPQARVLSIVEYPDSKLASLSALTINIPWANEISVCQTRSFSNLYLALVAISALYDARLKDGMERYLELRASVEERDFARVEKLVGAFDFASVASLGNGRQYGVTVEGSYICVEMAQMLCSYYGLLEYRHGPIVTCDDKTLLAVCSNENALSFEEQMAREAERAGAKVLAVVANGGFESAFARFSLEGDYPREAVALHFVFVLQAVAHWKAIARGLDPDHPGDLVPYIQI